MSKIQKNLKCNLETVASRGAVYSKLALCNTGNINITVSSDAILLNDMYSNYPFNFSAGLNSRCEFDFSGYKKSNVTLSAGECVNKTWNHNQECSFHDVKPGTYDVSFEQAVECYDESNNILETVLIGANSSFVL